MPRSTEQYIPGILPPKNYTPDVDFRRILSAFDPATISEEAMYEFARRDEFITTPTSEGYYTFQGSTHPIPWFTTAHRLSLAKIGLRVNLEDLELARVDTVNR